MLLVSDLNEHSREQILSSTKKVSVKSHHGTQEKHHEVSKKQHHSEEGIRICPKCNLNDLLSLPRVHEKPPSKQESPCNAEPCGESSRTYVPCSLCYCNLLQEDSVEDTWKTVSGNSVCTDNKTAGVLNELCSDNVSLAGYVETDAEDKEVKKDDETKMVSETLLLLTCCLLNTALYLNV